MNLSQLLMVIGVFVLAGIVKGVTGMGLPTVAMSLLGLWMSPVQAAAMLVLPSLATNVAQCRGPHLRQLAARLWPGWMAIAIVTVAAPGFGDTDSTESAKYWLGAILITYGAWGLWRPVLPDLSTRSTWLSAMAGAATGVVTAFTAVFVLPWVPYLQSLRLAKDEMVQALGLSFTVATLALVTCPVSPRH
ncbi:sulfite exporter TauE/SafE family protein [Paucibacter sp. M5-1]|uniref:sulfite exporter TauE/SafE family protein n=1 Tax=Paucibacter sp. M5-1 TaxID=3015998 RepID=UPI0022B87223|nr:sulfite exporter TauE/SafE family protein [Paucibacter sp. M5-1]MCZ7881126.1 sulfite exporter TauE/SafE family protein [Paucibacter sp. M5-1]